MPDFWIQIENHPWDVSPWRIDRMTGQSVAATSTPKTLTSPETGTSRTQQMWKPMPGDALILRRYTANWAAPDDRKVNPWDLNEPNPTDTGTMGTIPGPVIECQLGDTVTVHFRNKDARAGKPIEARTHSLHPHGFVFDPRYDGAYPLSPPDPSQPVGAEAALWAALGVTGSKRADRVPPGGTFTYTWQTIGWPTTAGVWLYHDHSICDMDNVRLGAIGIIVIHNPGDPEDLIIQTADLPGGSFVGSPFVLNCFPFDPPTSALPHDLIRLGHILPVGTPPRPPGDTGVKPPEEPMGMPGMTMTMPRAAVATPPAVAPSMAGMEMTGATHAAHGETEFHPLENEEEKRGGRKARQAEATADLSRSIQFGDTVLQLNKDLTTITKFCLRFYRNPPANAQYLLLFHDLDGVGMCINGRKYLGNTPTVLAGPQTDMRFGVVGMGNVDSFHTFHLHGHRWTLNGPHGTTRQQIQGSVQDTPVSQFEDTRTFGPANSFAFTIKEGSLGGLPSFMGPPPGAAVGEWHMHCHVLNHMMEGMMGSLLVVNGGELATALPTGVPCPTAGGPPPPGTIVVKNFAFTPNSLAVASGTTVNFDFQEANHTVRTMSSVNAGPITINNGGGDFDAVSPIPSVRSVVVTGSPGGTINYHCGIHGTGMAGTITVI
jgi:plastocyanin/FtsP/CotA-like multicopper oxidase with cupredoxin domain